MAEARPISVTTTASTTDAPRPLIAIISAIGIIVAVLTLPVVLLAGGPLNGWVLGVVLWAANWSLQLVTAKLLVHTTPTAAVGLAGVSFIARAWLVAIILFVIALNYDEQIGLTAGVVFLVAFTCDLVGRTILFALRQKATQDTPR